MVSLQRNPEKIRSLFHKPSHKYAAQISNEALPQTDEGCGACGWFVSFLVGLRQGLVKLEIFPEATLA